MLKAQDLAAKLGTSHNTCVAVRCWLQNSPRCIQQQQLSTKAHVQQIPQQCRIDAPAWCNQLRWTPDDLADVNATALHMSK